MKSMVFTRAIDHFRAFRNDETGAVTVDFVVLTASLMMLGAAHAKDVSDGSMRIADNIDGCIGEDVAAILDGDPKDYVANLQAAAAACSSR